jgi:hydroxymethylpyrimidine/phosphomethylpyrimidine kinase
MNGYGRSNSLAAYKTDNMELMAASIEIVNDVIKETEPGRLAAVVD